MMKDRYNGEEKPRILIDTTLCDNWDRIFPKIIHILLNEGIPVALHYYMEYPINNVKSIGDIPFDCMKNPGGIVLDQVKYYPNEGEKLQEKWLVMPNFEDLDTSAIPLSASEIILTPLSFRFERDIPDKKRLIFSYILSLKNIKGADIDPTFKVLLSVRINGKEYRVDYLFDNNKKNNLYYIKYPCKIISEINGCLLNYFWKIFWVGKPCAAWFRSNKGVMNYLGITKDTETVNVFAHQDLIKLISGPNGDSALILLSYTCFSILKRFFPSYPALKGSSNFIYVKRNIGKQIALNVRCSSCNIAEKMRDICCGFFLGFPSKSKKLPIIDGIQIQNTLKSRKLSVNEFESKTVSPSCPLWTNRIPASELLQSGQILDICLEPQDENDFKGFDEHFSVWMVYVLTNFIHDVTTNPSEEFEMSRGIEYLNEGYEDEKSSGIKKYSLDLRKSWHF